MIHNDRMEDVGEPLKAHINRQQHPNATLWFLVTEVFSAFMLNVYSSFMFTSYVTDRI